DDRERLSQRRGCPARRRHPHGAALGEGSMSEAEELPVLCDGAGPAAVITLNRPRVHNAISAEMADAIEAHVATVESDPAIRVAIIAARGKSFCAGADLKQVAANFGQPLKVRPGGFAGFVDAAREKPWIAAVHA